MLTRVDPIAHAGEGAGEGWPAHCADARQGDRLPGHRRRGGQEGTAPLAVMEAMKMEHTLTAPHDGTVEQLLYAVGDQVMEGEELLRLAAAA